MLHHGEFDRRRRTANTQVMPKFTYVATALRAIRTTARDVTGIGDHAVVTSVQTPTRPPNRFRRIRYRNVVLSMTELVCWAFLGGTVLGEVSVRLRCSFIHSGDVLTAVMAMAVIAMMVTDPLVASSRNISRIIRKSSRRKSSNMANVGKEDVAANRRAS